MKVPAFMLKKLYVPKSLVNEPGGWSFRLKNTLVPATLVGLPELNADGEAVDAKRIEIVIGDETLSLANSAPDASRPFKKDQEVTVRVQGPTLPPGRHKVEVKAKSKEFDVLAFDFEDTL